MHNLVQVRYRNNREGLVDDVTLNELILSNKIKQFYRPSENRWVNIDYDLIRAKSEGYKGPERRAVKKTAKETAKEEEPVSLMSRFLRRKPKEEPKEKPPTSQDWFEQGYSLMYATGDYQEAIRAFASSIQLDPANARAYLKRGMAYERINNMQQAIDDYSKAIELVPKDAKAYYMRGMLFRRFGKDMEAISDLRTSAELGYKLAKDFLNRKSPPTNEKPSDK